MAQRRQPIRIEPFRHPIAMDPGYPDKTWKILEDAIREIHNQNASGLSFEELYRNAYNMVLHKHGDRLYRGLVECLTKHLKFIAAEIEKSNGIPFLKELKKRWDDHNKSTQMIRDILMYMDRTYVSQQSRTPVYQLGLDLWREHVVRHKVIGERFRAIILDLIHKERSGEVADKGLIRSITQMLVDLGQQVYMEDFEAQFLTSSSGFYKKEAAEYMASSDCPTYMTRAERRLGEEVDRVAQYLDKDTEPKLTKVVERELLAQQMRSLIDMEHSGLVVLLKDDKTDDLKRMYSLLKRVPDGLQLVKNTMADHIKEVGKAHVMDQEKTKDPVVYVQGLLDMRDKYDVIVTTAFSDDKVFRNAMNGAFEWFINQNNRSPEYLSLFIDDKLRKGLKGGNDSDMEGLLDKVMALFRYLQEKDVFEKYYKQHLAKRLLAGRTVSDENEKALLVKLKTECGYQFTSKLESMFTDIKTSKDTMVEFKQRLTSRNIDLGLDLQVQVLTTGSWPTQQASKCNLPPVLENCCKEFADFYLQHHSGRKLTWQTNMGTADLRAEFGGADGPVKRHELNVSTHHMCILMLFNDRDRWTYREILDATEITPAELKRALQSLALVKGKNVLKKEPMGKEVNDTDVFVYNDKFVSKLIKVKISNVSASKEGETEKAETRQKVEEDRKPEIEAAIVRLMKARKVLDHNTIVMEVTKQLQSRFVANPTIIKKRIEGLIEREFLERDSEDRKLYRYLA